MVRLEHLVVYHLCGRFYLKCGPARTSAEHTVAFFFSGMNERGKNDTRAAVKLRGSVVRSLGEDIRVVLVERKRSSALTAKGRLSRGQRMVAHHVADVSFLFAVMVRRRAFFHEDPSIVFFFAVRLFVAPFDKVEVEPGFVVATLVSRADTKSFMGNGDCAELTNFPLFFRIRRSQESTNVLSPGIAPGPHNGAGPGGIGKAQSAKASSMIEILLLLSRRHAAPLKSPATKSTFSSTITARIVRISFFPMPRFLV